MKIPFVKTVNNKQQLYETLLSVLQCFLPNSKKLTVKEIDIFSYLLSKGEFPKQLKGTNRMKNASALELSETAFAMHRSRIAKKGWINDSLPDRFVNNLSLKIENENPEEIEINIKLKWKTSLNEQLNR